MAEETRLVGRRVDVKVEGQKTVYRAVGTRGGWLALYPPDDGPPRYVVDEARRVFDDRGGYVGRATLV